MSDQEALDMIATELDGWPNLQTNIETIRELVAATGRDIPGEEEG
jgi:hypothetical protein